MAAKLASAEMSFTSVDLVTDPDVDALELAVARQPASASDMV